MATADAQPSPRTVAELLAQHKLDSYSEAFAEEGWDDLQQLQSIDEVTLVQLISDVKMKSRHTACIPVYFAVYHLLLYTGIQQPNVATGIQQACRLYTCIQVYRYT